MEDLVITDAQIREYLLGVLDVGSELVEQIDERFITDSEFSLSVDVVEDEIIEEYLEGTLSPEELPAVERYFLRPPERQLKLKSARLFASHLATTFVGNAVPPAPGAVLPFIAKRQPFKLTARFRTFTEIAALLLFTFSLSYLLYQRHRLDAAVQESNQQLKKERQHSANLSQQLQARLQPSTPSIVAINLFESGLRRGISGLPEATISAAATTLHVEVALTSSAAGKYQVQLEQAGTIIWFHGDADAVKVPGGAVLKLDIPAESLSNGTCELSVSPQGTRKISYWFLVKKTR